ncbi:unnamed protein product [Fraxinus pennsylvanica]|uniref:Uncharacterized protein n=1 Tax=Fraxinus pennsylvanica TaxID=56036 RepID=A0AAD2E4V9_9LAMI|nr:unnamed protein product [Fraxinus pennsylvanica]
MDFICFVNAVGTFLSHHLLASYVKLDMLSFLHYIGVDVFWNSTRASKATNVGARVFIFSKSFEFELSDFADDGLELELELELATLAAAMNLHHNLAKIQADAMPEHYKA